MNAAAPRRDEAGTALWTALRDGALLALVLALVGGAVGAVVSGLPGVWGALLGAGIALVFQGVTAASLLLTARSGPPVAAAAALGSWLGKIVVLVAVLALLRGARWYDPVVLFVTLVVAVLGTLALDVRAVMRARVPNVTPSAAWPQPPEDGQ